MTKPMFVRVAESFGWTHCFEQSGVYLGRPPKGTEVKEVPPFDQSWCLIGPLVETNGFSLLKTDDGWQASNLGGASVKEDTPCRAVCALLLMVNANRMFD